MRVSISVPTLTSLLRFIGKVGLTVLVLAERKEGELPRSFQ